MPEPIDNPIINSPYEKPQRHFAIGSQGVINRQDKGRRPSSYLVPVAAPRKRGPQLAFDELEQEVRSNPLINRIREDVALWREAGYPGVTGVTRGLLEHWCDPKRDRRLFFCQIEAVETAIFITEVASKDGASWLGQIQAHNKDYSEVLRRLAFKIATGGGKTVVMAMFIAWHTLNKVANTGDGRFSLAFLIVSPNLTIRDRLRVLLPSDPDNVYRAMDLVPPLQLETLNRATVTVANFHQFLRRDRGDAAKLTKQMLNPNSDTSPFVETPDEMAARVCRDIPAKQKQWGIVVINDEAHHCYRRKESPVEAEDAALIEMMDRSLTAEERREADKQEREAAVWISGIEAVARKFGVKAVYDLSATPFFLKGSGHPEGTLFPWVVSDFSLIDAIESGIVKIPRVPVADNRDEGDLPTYRNLWKHVGRVLPKRASSVNRDGAGAPALPTDLEGALRSLYGNYALSFEAWKKEGHSRPPVFIVVCSNTTVSKMVYDWIAGFEQMKDDVDSRWVPGKLPLFSNVDGDVPLARPNTILIDSRELESGEPLSADFKKAATVEIERFKDEYRRRFPGRDTDSLTDADLLREVMNTVGKPGRLGEGVRAVVSVSMLSEGWDANTVTHILGVRAFSTQLLCEQVIGRALRRASYVPDDNGMFLPEYAEVYGVPFTFIPTAAASSAPKLPVIPTTVRALDERATMEITFPRVSGYRQEITGETLTPQFGPDSRMTLTTRDAVTKTELDPIVGTGSVHDLSELRGRREQEVAFVLARRLHLDHFSDADGNVQVWLFPRLLEISKEWLATCLDYNRDEAYPQLLLMHELSVKAAEKIARAIQRDGGTSRVRAVLDPSKPIGSTAGVLFETIKKVVPTTKSHVDHVVMDSNWESKMAGVLEEMPEVLCYVKNDRIGFEVPYVFEGKQKSYRPDFIAYIDDGHGIDDPLKVVIEVTGERKDAKEAKVATASTLWVPAVNALATMGRWRCVEVLDPWLGADPIRQAIRAIKESLHAA
ncbi:MAG: BPTD_3080 family restriction endonuclease [Candidatus Acidiferrales bacterium]